MVHISKAAVRALVEAEQCGSDGADGMPVSGEEESLALARLLVMGGADVDVDGCGVPSTCVEADASQL
ncbi:hypothetical protein [Streptomyces luteireticuli]|uniref:hypothetical protein n=1 Tax=Streptomyces luteireticuli TaxID=173858 RepID=UPI0035574392